MEFVKGSIKLYSMNFTGQPFAKKIYSDIETLQNDLDEYISTTMKERTRESGVQEELSWKLSSKERRFKTRKI